jgi:hypothetical protein
VYSKFGESASFWKRSGLQSRFPGVRLPPPALNVAPDFYSDVLIDNSTAEQTQHARPGPAVLPHTAEHHCIPVASTVAPHADVGHLRCPVADAPCPAPEITADAADG